MNFVWFFDDESRGLCSFRSVSSMVLQRLRLWWLSAMTGQYRVCWSVVVWYCFRWWGDERIGEMSEGVDDWKAVDTMPYSIVIICHLHLIHCLAISACTTLAAGACWCLLVMWVHESPAGLSESHSLKCQPLGKRLLLSKSCDCCWLRRL